MTAQFSGVVLSPCERAANHVRVSIVGMVAIALAMMSILASAEDGKGSANRSEMDTEHLFGFTEGTSIGEKGEREIEIDSTVRTGKGSGSFVDPTSEFEFKYTVFENFRISAAATLAYFDISSVPGIVDTQHGAAQSASFNARFRLLDRDHAPVGLTLSLEPHWGFVDETSGVPASHFGTEIVMRADRELAPDFLYGAVNVLFQNDRTRAVASDGLLHESLLGFGFGVAAQVRPGIWLGGEVRYLRNYDGSYLDVFSGQAVYFGPTFYARLGPNAWLSAAWNVQLWGSNVTTPGELDLTDFERYQFKFRVGVDF